MTDRRLTLACSAALFVLCAWPVALVRLPPLQDVPNHLAAIHILAHPGLYPELASNGFVKTNAALFAWGASVEGLIGPWWALRAFVLLVLAANALAFPRLLLELSGRRAVVVGSLFLAPMVHNWFVSMGMLDFALSCALVLLGVATMERQRREPSALRAVAIGALALAAWWSHALPLFVWHLLAAIELAVTARRSFADAVHLAKVSLLPLLPSTVVTLVLAAGVAPGRFSHSPSVIDLVYNLWAQFFYGFTRASLSSLVPCLVLGFFALRGWRRPIPFFSPVALVALAALYLVLPDAIQGWFYINTRFVPFVWAALVVRVPLRIPRSLAGVLVAATLAYSASLGVDYVTLARDQAAFNRAIPVVAERARLLPLVFDPKGSSDNTRHLSQAWGTYVVAKDTAAPLVFATQPSYAVRYRVPPPPGLDQVALEDWFGAMKSTRKFCGELQSDGVTTGDCEGTFRAYWAAFFARVAPLYDHLLLWGAADEVLALVPPPYERVFAEGALVLYRRPAGSVPP